MKKKNQRLSFKDRVYKVVKKIPRGKTLSYKEVATLAGNSFASRAVGNIMSRNHNVSIPCHRVIRSDGRTCGYNGGSRRKIEILLAEGAHLR